MGDVGAVAGPGSDLELSEECTIRPRGAIHTCARWRSVRWVASLAGSRFATDSSKQTAASSYCFLKHSLSSAAARQSERPSLLRQQHSKIVERHCEALLHRRCHTQASACHSQHLFPLVLLPFGRRGQAQHHLKPTSQQQQGHLKPTSRYCVTASL